VFTAHLLLFFKRKPIKLSAVINLPTNSTNSTNPTTPSPGENASGQVNPGSATKAAETSVGVALLKQIQQGQTLVAQVKSSQVLNDSQKSLLEKVNPSLVEQLARQQKNEASIPATNVSSSPKGLSTTLAKTDLHLVKLLVENQSHKPQLVTTITTHNLKINDKVLLAYQQQQLLLKNLTSSDGQLHQGEQQRVEKQEAITQMAMRALPKQESLSQLHNFIQRFMQLPNNLQSIFVDNNTQKLLQNLSQFIYSAPQLSTGKQLQRALENSGVQFETKIARNQGLTQDLRFTLEKAIQTLANKNLQQSTHAISTVNNSSQTPAQNHFSTLIKNLSPEKLATKNVTEQLFVAITKEQSVSPRDIDKLLSLLAAQQTNSNIANLQQANAKIPNSTAALFRLLGLQIPADNQAAISLTQVFDQRLKKLFEQVQSRIQLHQLRSLNLEKALGDSRSTPLQQFHAELSLRFQDQVYPLQININEQEIERENTQEHSPESKQETPQKERKWQVFMSFDLPNNESLHSQLNIVHNTVSVTLWTESFKLCQKAQEEINILRDKLLAKGLTVEDLICVQGKPPQQNNGLAYNLVDITT
jgi:hypothetical protein